MRCAGGVWGKPQQRLAVDSHQLLLHLDTKSSNQHRFAPLRHASRPACSITWLGLTPAPEVDEPVGMLGAPGKAVPACVCVLPRLKFLDISGGDDRGGSARVARELLLISCWCLGSRLPSCRRSSLSLLPHATACGLQRAVACVGLRLHCGSSRSSLDW